jgi:hypothetical protein
MAKITINGQEYNIDDGLVSALLLGQGQGQQLPGQTAIGGSYPNGQGGQGSLSVDYYGQAQELSPFANFGHRSAGESFGQLQDSFAYNKQLGAMKDAGQLSDSQFGRLKGASVAGGIGAAIEGVGRVAEDAMRLGRTVGYGLSQYALTKRKLKSYRENIADSMRDNYVGLGTYGGGGELLGELTGEYMHGLPMGMEGIATGEVEGGEYVQSPDGTVAEVEGARHESGGVVTGAEGYVISDRLPIGGRIAKEIRDRYGIDVKAGDTYATVVDKYKKKIGLKKAYETQGEFIERLKKNEAVKDSATRELNKQYLWEKIREVKLEEIDRLTPSFEDFVGVMYGVQEGVKHLTPVPSPQERGGMGAGDGVEEYGEGGELWNRLNARLKSGHKLTEKETKELNEVFAEAKRRLDKAFEGNTDSYMDLLGRNIPLALKEELMPPVHRIKLNQPLSPIRSARERLKTVAELKTVVEAKRRLDKALEGNTDSYMDRLFGEVTDPLTGKKIRLGLVAPEVKPLEWTQNSRPTKDEGKDEGKDEAKDEGKDEEYGKLGSSFWPAVGIDLPPSPLQLPTLGEIDYERLTPRLGSTTNPMLHEMGYNSMLQQEGLPDQVRGAVAASLLAQTQDAANKYYSGATARNAALQGDADRYNAQMQGQEDAMNLRLRQEYERVAQAALGNQWDLWGNWLSAQTTKAAQADRDRRMFNLTNSINENYYVDNNGNVRRRGGMKFTFGEG